MSSNFAFGTDDCVSFSFTGSNSPIILLTQLLAGLTDGEMCDIHCTNCMVWNFHYKCYSAQMVKELSLLLIPKVDYHDPVQSTPPSYILSYIHFNNIILSNP
jgi:hypothetical protein